MRNGLFLLAVAGALSAFGFAVHAAEETALPERVPDFTLRDQFNDEHRVEFPRDRPTVLALADRKGSEQLEGWLKPLGERFEKVAHIDGVADVRGVPKPLRWGVRQLFKRGSKQPIMLDWENTVCAALVYEEKKANILVIDREGTIVHRVHGEVDEAGLQRVIEVLEGLLRAP